MAAPKHAVEFDKIIDAGRERKKNEALAARIFNRDSGRRSSTPTRTSSPGAGSLASRVGVKKASTQTARPGNVKSDWVHDLHKSHDKTKQPAPNSLAARIHAPGTAAPKQPIQPRQNRAAKLVDAYSRSTSTAAALQVNQQQGQGMTIRGLAGPFTIMAQNFAPGTTAADIESAMTPIGGLITACRLIKAHPIVIAEIVFESKEGAERVIQTFNNQNADGRTLHVYPKPVAAYHPTPGAAPSAPRSSRSNGNLVDGSMGFDDPMDTTSSQPLRQGNQSTGRTSNTRGGLYSDSLVRNHSDNTGPPRRGRGSRPRGGAGR
ncbi:polymerase delta-interacting protein 3 [Microdochium nivale]|nr:polymerase delta-interacting protein 3 [Microdochium nivale]